MDEVEREYGISGAAKIASNENPFGPSPKAVQALSQRLHQLHLYPDGDCFYLKRVLAPKLGVTPEQILVGNGSNELIELAVRTFMQPGDEAVMAHQAFVIFRLVVQAAGCIPKVIPLREFTHDLEAIAGAITPKTRLVFLANPNNPTGTIYRRDEWEAFLRMVNPEVLLVVDEAYFEYVRDPEYPNSLSYHEGQTILTLRTFSKLYGLAGLRIGYGVASEELVGWMNRVRQPFNVNAAAQWAAIAALEDEDHMRRSLELNRDGMDYLERELDRLGVEYVPSQANFLLIRVGNGQKIFTKLLPRGVIVRSMDGYDLPEHIRATVGTQDENIKFIRELKGVIKGHSKQLEKL